MKSIFSLIAFVMLVGSLASAGEHSFRKIWNLTNGRAFTATTREMIYKAQHKKKKKELMALAGEAKLAAVGLELGKSVVLSSTMQTLVQELRNSDAAKDLANLSDIETVTVVYTSLALMGADGEEARVEAQRLVQNQLNLEQKN